MFYIKSLNDYWTGHSWTTRIEIAREYDFIEGMEVIDRRFGKGVRKAKRSGELYWIEKPELTDEDIRK